VSKSIWFYNEVGHNQISRKEIINIFGDYLFDTPKPVGLLERILRLSLKNSNNIVLDFFAGSGTTAHAVMKLNKEDGGKRKYILIEIAKYFDTVVIPRLKKICYSFNWKDGKPQDNDGISQIIKYHYLEQYEDTLHNIDFPQEEKGQKILDLLPEEGKSEYLMKYMLKFETEGSPSLLNLKQFTNPFEYKLKIISANNKEEIVNIDLVETFNYLIGLKINKYRYLTDKGRKYVFVLGERNYRKVAIVWRSTVDINLEKDKENIDKIINDFKPEEIYINGDSMVKNYKPIESEFKSRAGV
jgi:adenine-specific DNA-methyltransferase